MFTASALKAAEAEFHRLVPAPLFLQDTDLEKAGVLSAGGLDLLAARDLLLAPGTGREAKDAVWRAVIARARWSGEWMVGAMGLAMPALSAAVRRCARGLSAEQAAEVESEVAAGFIAAVREINTGYASLSRAGFFRGSEPTLRCPMTPIPAGRSRPRTRPVGPGRSRRATCGG
ncbi:hypothetical protein [Nocardiopsis composta]|uniref:Uncharacterized protein n=1 Tax=Nocardiopsis composta TaxID=157465 RepID=A0A7W8VG24_9ACTN|nr:hypothetical protein [Nocardiopsis composta]MBB5435191.1 hypothetical protein [Nocardiopsis composta]